MEKLARDKVKKYKKERQAAKEAEQLAERKRMQEHRERMKNVKGRMSKKSTPNKAFQSPNPNGGVIVVDLDSPPPPPRLPNPPKASAVKNSAAKQRSVVVLDPVDPKPSPKAEEAERKRQVCMYPSSTWHPCHLIILLFRFFLFRPIGLFFSLY